MTEEEIRAEERRVLGKHLKGMVDGWRCNSTEIEETAKALLGGKRPEYDVRKYGMKTPCVPS